MLELLFSYYKTLHSGSKRPDFSASKNKAITFAFGIMIGFACCLLLGFLIEEQSVPSENPFHPKSIFVLDRKGYSLAYDGRTKGAIWVYERLTPESVSNDAISRDGFRFLEDEDIPTILRSSNEDFRGSGYDRGHLCPAGDCKSSKEAMRDSFLLSNVSPQLANLNRGAWKDLEGQIQQLALDGKTVHVYSLPLYLPLEVDGQRFVHYRMIGKHDVAVPTHFAKIAAIEGEDSLIAYILPNARIPENIPLDSFKTTIEKVEKAAGMIFPNPETFFIAPKN